LASNHLEDLVAEWYQLRGFFVRRNVQVGKRSRGGNECELDELAGGRIVLVREFMQEILAALRGRRVASAAVPEEYPLLRTLQFAVEFWPLADPTPPV
jgi:hypothetical protein